MNWLNLDYLNLNNVTKCEKNFNTLNDWPVYDSFNCNNIASGDTIDPGQVYYSWDLEEAWQKKESNSNLLNIQVNHKTGEF